MNKLSCFVPALVLLASSQAFAADESIDNGTDPTKLSTNFALQYKYLDYGSDYSSGLFEAVYTTPLGAAKHMSLAFTLPYASSPLDHDFGFGDAKVKFTHVVSLNQKRGLVYTAEVAFDTANRIDLGTGETVLKLSGFYAKFLKNGAIFAPALVQEFNITDTSGRRGVNTTTMDFYYVAKLANPKVFVTYDPALVYDWKTNANYASLQVTIGRSLGKAFGGNSQMFIKPQLLGGGERPLDWSFQVGYKVIGF